MDEQTRARLDQYVTQLFVPDDTVFQQIQQEALRQEIPALNLRPFEGRLLQFLAELVGARKILEIGTLAGYSGTWLAQVLPDDGTLHTIELLEERAAVARKNFQMAGVGDKVQVHQGNSHAVLERLVGEAPFDMIFLDADKQSYPYYLQWAAEHLRSGGLLAAHNAFRRGRVLAPVGDGDEELIEFNEMLAEDERFSSFIIGVGDGFAVGLRK